MHQERRCARYRSRMVQTVAASELQKSVPAGMKRYFVYTVPPTIIGPQLRPLPVYFGCQSTHIGTAKLHTIFGQRRHGRLCDVTRNRFMQDPVDLLKVVVDQVRHLIGDLMCVPSHGLPRCRASP